MAFLRTLKKAEVPDGTIREFQLEGKTLAISNVGGKHWLRASWLGMW